ncbi:hypothetical protein JTB14_022457 [Gonioctena quinquepunctata]|nr:hypothetical protein JTB14_022457 [Gonioctena quinquepunctata]
MKRVLLVAAVIPGEKETNRIILVSITLDLAFCSPNIAPLLQWICLGNHLTDHFPIKLECASQNVSRLVPRRWKMEKAILPFYKTKVDTIELLPDDVNEATEVFVQNIKEQLKTQYLKLGESVEKNGTMVEQ